MEKEIWKDIPSYDSYQVSNFGRVKSFRTSKPRILKNQLAVRGYYVVRLTNNDGIIKTKNIHYLVASAFIGERPEGYFVCHLDGNELNNNLNNISYDTPKSNSVDIYRHGRKGGVGKLSLFEVSFIRELYKTEKHSQLKLSKMFNISKMNINHIIKKRTFKYTDKKGNIIDSETRIIYNESI